MQAVKLWCQMQNAKEVQSGLEFTKAASRLLWVVEDFWNTITHQMEAEAVVMQSAAADLQSQVSAAESGYRLEGQANDAADDAEIDVEPQIQLRL